VILLKVCKHKAPWAVKRLVLPLPQKAFQGNLSLPAKWRRCLSLHLVGREKISTCFQKKQRQPSVLTPGSASAVEPPGADKADDRTAVRQASSSETDEPDESQMDSVEEEEKGNMNSPPETVTKPGSTLACSAATGPGGETAGRKRKTQVGPHHLKLKR